MSAKTFIDTSVFVFQLDTSDARKQAIAEGIVRDALNERSGCISYQVVQEFLNVACCKAQVPLNVEQAGAYLDTVLLPLLHVGASAELFRRALAIRARWRFGIHDSLIVGAALMAGCSRLLTEDLRHGQRIEGLTVVDPFGH